jgi:glycerol-3-phosphate dehydrogenase (NAD(P)+)
MSPRESNTRFAVMGSGSWGTAFAAVLADAGSDVVLWARHPQTAQAINSQHENAVYHPGITLPAAIVATSDPVEAIADADVIALAVPAQHLREHLALWAPAIGRSALLVSLVKGIELGTAKRMSEVIREVVDAPADRVAVITGPNLAAEVLRRQPAATVVACTDEAVATQLQHACHTAYFRPYTGTDVIGAELGGAVKNVIALANGVAAGMGYGENAQATVITRGLAEMTRLGIAMGAAPLTFSGLAGIGDLVATCTSPLSRNRSFGVNLGRGMTVAEASAAMSQTSEAVKSCRPILELAVGHGVDMPITDAVVRVVHEGLAPEQMARDLMSRDAKPEHSAR